MHFLSLLLADAPKGRKEGREEETVKTASDFGLDISQDALNEIFDLFE